MYVRESGALGVGFRIRKGDTVRLPTEFLKVTPHPTKGNVIFTRHGLSLFAKHLFLQTFPKTDEDFASDIEARRKSSDEYLENCEVLKGLNLDSPDDAADAWARLRATNEGKEWWNALSSTFLTIAEQAIAEGNARQAAWASAGAERFRALFAFKEHFEETVWMGHSASRIVSVLRAWNSQCDNSREEYWQKLFSENTFVLSQVFAAPIVVIQEKAYVGGSTFTKEGGKLADYLLAGTDSRQALIVEIKTPTTKLLGGKYRSGFSMSPELTGAIGQVRGYQVQLMESRAYIFESHPLTPGKLTPRCVLVIGNGSAELDTEEKRRAFELFRTSLSGVELITFDELFKKVEILGELFQLVKQRATDDGTARADLDGFPPQ